MGSGVYLDSFLTSTALDRGKWSALRSGRFTSGVRTPQCPLARSLSGPQRTRSERPGEEKTLLSVPIIQPPFLHRPARSLITVPAAYFVEYCYMARWMGHGQYQRKYEMQQNFFPAYLNGSSHVVSLCQSDDNIEIKVRKTGASGGLLFAW